MSLLHARALCRILHSMHRTHIQIVFFFVLLLGVLVLAFFLFLPYLTTLAVAATFAVVTCPLHRRLVFLLRKREGLAALLTVLLTILLVLLPLSFIGTQVVRESQHLYERIVENRESLTESFTGFLEGTSERYAPQMSFDLSRYAGQGLSWLAGKIGLLFAGTAQTVLHLFLGIIAFYYFLKDGRRFLSSLITLSPLADEDDVAVLGRLETAITAIVRGSLVIAVVQGIMTGIGLAIFGVPSPTLWGSIAAIGALVPGVGTAVILAPTILFLFVTGKTLAALGLLLWGIVAVGLIDNFLGPVLVGRGVKIHPLFILFAVIGGLGFFGPVGFLLGPLVLSLLYALVDIYRVLLERNPSRGR